MITFRDVYSLALCVQCISLINSLLRSLVNIPPINSTDISNMIAVLNAWQVELNQKLVDLCEEYSHE